jgi:creatinine amidohydrolase
MNIFADTIAEMTWYEVEQAAKDGAILLWSFGVIEQHGPHLPAGTDVYIPQARLRETKRMLAERGIQALIVPPYYWGINRVSAAFPASYQVSAQTMKALMSDIFASLARDGFKTVFCFSGHGEHMHNLTIHEGIQEAVAATGMDISFVVDTALQLRLGLRADDPCLTIHKSGSGKLFGALTASPSAFDEDEDKPPKFVDVHAGQWESSIMLCTCPDLVHDEVRKTLLSTDFGPDDLAEWRKGFEHSRKKTPLGYLGDPAAATEEEGRRSLFLSAERAADAIQERLAKR